jgi:hypothetical protein
MGMRLILNTIKTNNMRETFSGIMVSVVLIIITLILQNFKGKKTLSWSLKTQVATAFS